MTTESTRLFGRSGVWRAPADGRRAPTSTATDGFYDCDRPISAEAARLHRMAGAADAVSLAALGTAADRPGVVVADVGSGESTSLGAALTARNPSLIYLPIDMRPDAVDGHRARGFDGRVGSATDLPLGDATVDIVHARFLFAWLDPDGRRRAVEEMLRVCRGAARAVVIDYDWGSADGPDVVVTWKEKLLGLLVPFGFDPYYGRRLADDMRRHVSDAGVYPAHWSLSVTRSTAIEPMRDALVSMNVTVEPVVDRLAAVGLDEVADELRDVHTAVVDHCRRHPDTPITFPTMVATAVDVTPAAVAAAAEIGRRRVARRRIEPTTRLPSAGPAELGVYRLESDDLIGQARRLHAAEYLKHGHHTDASVDSDGFLIAEIDPPEIVARSAYLGVLDDDGHVAGCIRMIRPVDGDMTTLPTLHKLAAGRGPAGGRLAGLLFPAGSAVFEVSGLAKASRHLDRALTTRLLLAVVSEARRCGYDFGVMGVVATTARLLTAIYGRHAIRPLGDALGAITLAGTGIREGGVTLVPCYSEAATFVNDCLQHCVASPERPLNRLNRPLIELTADALAAAPIASGAPA